VLAGLIVAAFMYSSKAQEYRSSFKMLIVEQWCGWWAASLRYWPKNHISESEYDASRLFRSRDRFNGEDLVQGRVGDTQLQFSEIHAEYKTTNSKGQTSWHTFFAACFLSPTSTSTSTASPLSSRITPSASWAALPVAAGVW
jgi:hypothetical protein